MFSDISDFVVLFSLEFDVDCVCVIVDGCPHWLSSRYFVIRRGVMKGFSFPSVSDCSHLNIIGLGCRCVVYNHSRAARRTCCMFDSCQSISGEDDHQEIISYRKFCYMIAISPVSKIADNLILQILSASNLTLRKLFLVIDEGHRCGQSDIFLIDLRLIGGCWHF